MRFRPIPTFVLPLALAAGLTASVHAQVAAIDKARGDLETARVDLRALKSEQLNLRRALYQEINRLDERALELGRELRALDREEELRSTNRQRLDRIIEGREIEYDYVSGILSQYGEGLKARLHAAELQRYDEKIGTLQRRALAAGEDRSARLDERLHVVKLGLDRLGDVMSGTLFEGRALRSGESLKGKFLIAGPAGFFAGNGDFAGVVTFSEGDTGIPSVVPLDPSGNSAIAATVRNGEGVAPVDGSMGKALLIEETNESLGETITKGGIVGYAILVLGAMALLIAAFKVLEIQRFHVPSRRKINEILDDLINGRQDAARSNAATIPGVAGDLVRTGVEHFHGKRRVLEELLYEKLVAVRPRLDRFLPFLSLTAAAAPLMGLLGTVLGIIKTFKMMAIHGTGNAKNFSGGISEALITTAQGLVVAIPILIIHGMLKSFAKSRFGQTEAVAVALMNGTSEVEGSPHVIVSEKTDSDDEQLEGEALLA